jgi:hypothetical protein
MSDSLNPWSQGRALGLGLGLLALVPGMAAADRGYSAGHAEISLGFPNGAITVGRTWENAPREVVVERVTHKLPETDYADEAIDEGYSEADVYEDDAQEDEQVIIEKRRPRVAKKVTIIEQYEEPRYVEREVVVRKVYVEPPCPPTQVIVQHAPTRVVYAPSPTVIVHSPRSVHRVHVHGGGHHRGGHGYRHGGGSYRVHDHGTRDLFSGDGGRPMRTRGSRNLVQVGGHHH